jgi:sterol desaturase/sphingolipid hydroxylase (fatty acid hydroxylase superfamily)
MNTFREALLIFVSVPVYAIVIGVELLFSYLHDRKLYSTKGVLANVYLTTLNMGIDILLRGICLFVLTYFFQFKFMDLSATPVLYWGLLVFGQDFMFYWLHRADHFCRVFWAIHVTHHSSEEFNLTVGFRSSVFQPLYRFIYFIPLALCGFKGLDIMFIYSATQIFGILAHTQTVDKLGFLEYIFVTPSHHRVHHGSNTRYLDKNMGMLFIFWDKLFGTFQPEDPKDPVRYGLTTNLDSHDPVNVVFHEWKSIVKDVLNPNVTFKAKWMYLFGPPGWSHDGSRKTSAQLKSELRQQELMHDLGQDDEERLLRLGGNVLSDGGHAGH